MKKAVAYANANIALVKYWGKRDDNLNIPDVPSLSLTLNDFGTTVHLTNTDEDRHSASIDEKPVAEKVFMRLQTLLEQWRQFYPYRGYLDVRSSSTIPFAAGLASSSAFFAALAQAFNDIFALSLTKTEISCLARLGSGSAARSIFPGFVGLHGGAISHDEAHAFPIVAHEQLDLVMIVAVVDAEEKAISSREAMTRSKETSPFYQQFVSAQNDDMTHACSAVNEGCFSSLGAIMESSTLKMFATMWTASPAINYWQPASLALINLVYQLRQQHGPIAFFTMDAGPNVKILCHRDQAHVVLDALRKIQCVKDHFVLTSGPGAS